MSFWSRGHRCMPPDPSVEHASYHLALRVMAAIDERPDIGADPKEAWGRLYGKVKLIAVEEIERYEGRVRPVRRRKWWSR